MQPLEECRDGQPLTFDNFKIGMSVRATAKIFLVNKDAEPILVGSRAKVFLHYEKKSTKFLSLMWNQTWWDFDDLRDIVISEH